MSISTHNGLKLEEKIITADKELSKGIYRIKSFCVLPQNVYFKISKDKYETVCETYYYRDIIEKTNLDRYSALIALSIISDNKNLTNLDDSSDFYDRYQKLISEHPLLKKDSGAQVIRRHPFNMIYLFNSSFTYSTLTRDYIKKQIQTEVLDKGFKLSDYLPSILHHSKIFNFSNDLRVSAEELSNIGYKVMAKSSSKARSGIKLTEVRDYLDDGSFTREEHSEYSSILFDFKSMKFKFTKSSLDIIGKFSFDLNADSKIFIDDKPSAAFKEVSLALLSYYKQVGKIKDKSEYFGYKNFSNFVQQKLKGDSTITDYIFYIDKIMNSPYYKTVILNANSLVFKNEYLSNKDKINDLFEINKNAFKKLVSLNEREQSNFLAFRRAISKNELLNTEENVNLLFSDAFTMVEDYSIDSIKRILNFENFNEYFKKMSDFKKFVSYISQDVVERQRISISPAANLYLDYIYSFDMLVQLGYNRKESFIIDPFSLKLSHDIVTDEFSNIQRINNDKLLKIKYDDKVEKIISAKYKYNGKEVVLLKGDTVESLKDEGRQLSHCVGSYASRIINGKCIILFARYKESESTSWYTIELRKTSNGFALGQTQSKNSHKLPKELEEQLMKQVKKVN